MKSNKIQTLINQICKLNDVKIELHKLNCDSNIPNAIHRINKAIKAIKVSLVRNNFYVFDDGNGTVSCINISKENVEVLLSQNHVLDNDIDITIKEDDNVIIDIVSSNIVYTLEGTNAYEFIELLERAHHLKK